MILQEATIVGSEYDQILQQHFFFLEIKSDTRGTLTARSWSF